MSVERHAARREGSPAGVASRFVDAGGINTHYLECGEAGAPPVVLVHGGGAGANATGNWRETMPAFARRHRVVAVEMPGFGETEKPEGGFQYSQPERNAHLAAFLEALGLGPVPLVGNSMGGATALGVAMERPELVSALVLMGSAGLNATITPALAPILRYDFTIEGMRRLIDGLTGPRFTASDDVVRSRYEDSIRPDARRAYLAAMAWITRQGGLFYEEDRIASVKTETLVVNGKHDRVVPLSCAYRFLELLENSRGYIVPHCGHWVMIEAPDEFAEVVLQFLARVGRAQ
jgi:2-hydroxy-6-oxo-6-(2'-aminophenyl)hexa-2,4-dienoate hydrolase